MTENEEKFEAEGCDDITFYSEEAMWEYLSNDYSPIYTHCSKDLMFSAIRNRNGWAAFIVIDHIINENDEKTFEVTWFKELKQALHYCDK